MKFLGLLFAFSSVIATSGCSTEGSNAEADGTAAVPAPAAMTLEHRIEMADSVLRTLEGFRLAVAAMDPEGVSEFYADDPDMRWVEDGEVRYRSREDVADAVRAFAPTMDSSSVMYHGTEIMPVAPGVAVVVTGFAQRFTTTEGETGGFAGSITMVMVNRDDRWRFLNGHTSSKHDRGLE